MVTGLQEIDRLKNQVQDVHVPFEVFDYIDQGKNPQLYTKDCIEKALMKNEEVKGKIDAYRKFKTNMLVELQKSFPNELNKYRAVRGDEWWWIETILWIRKLWLFFLTKIFPSSTFYLTKSQILTFIKCDHDPTPFHHLRLYNQIKASF